MDESGSEWSELQGNMLDVCKQVCGETSGGRVRERETWWWNATEQQVIKDKKSAFKQWQRSRCELDREEYKLRKRVVAQSKADSLDARCEELRFAAGRRKMFAMAKQMRNEKKDIVGGYFVKKTSGEIATTEEDITSVWKEYFSTLLNVENNNEIEEVECVH